MEERKRIKSNIDIKTMSFGKIPPQARELEEVILGAIMIESSCLPTVLNLIFKEVFYVEAHEHIFEAITNLYDKSKTVDILTVVEQLIKNERLESVGGAYAVTKLTNSVVSSANIEDHCRVVLEKHLKREAIRIGGEFIGNAYEDYTDAFELYDKADDEILKTQEKVLKGSVKDMGHYCARVYSEYETVKDTGVIGISTMIEPIDRILSGLVAPDLFIIAARPSQGKTGLALTITKNVSIDQNKAGAWFSLEMDGGQLCRRLASIDTMIPHNNIRQGNIFQNREKDFYDSLDKISRSPIYIEDKPSINIRSLRTRANVLRRKNKIEYIIVDYLQLMSSVDPRNTNRTDVVGEISRGLKCLAKELDIPVIALSQLSREVEKRSDKMPQMSDLRESGSIEQDADSVLFLMRPEKYGFTEPVDIGGKEYDTKGLCIGKIDKNRHGECKNFAMGFVGECMKFTTHENDENSFIPNQRIIYPASQQNENIF